MAGAAYLRRRPSGIIFLKVKQPATIVHVAELGWMDVFMQFFCVINSREFKQFEFGFEITNNSFRIEDAVPVKF